MAKYWQFTSESVTEGHPDKVCDQISDAILDEILRLDPKARVACETAVTTGLVLVMGEITTSAYVEIPEVVRRTIREIGYKDKISGFDADSCAVLVSIDGQSQDIAQGVDRALEDRDKQDVHDFQQGAGDQGIMFGFANRDTEEFMPLPISLAHKLCRQMAKVRKEGKAKTFYPDGKAQVTVRYEENKPIHLDDIVISSQHPADAKREDLVEEIKRLVLEPVLPADLYDADTKLFINPTGRFVIGGPEGDSGLTGRKIIVDTYGGFSRHGGGAFSGKDPSKVDRSASYMARYLAKNIVAAGLADACEIQLSYAIGVAHPLSIFVETFGTGKLLDSQLAQMIEESIDLRPMAIIQRFDLTRPLYQQVAAYGHFGRDDLNLPWEQLDSVDLFRSYVAELK